MLRTMMLLLGLSVLVGCHSTKETVAKNKADKPAMLVDFRESEGLMPLIEQAKKQGKLVFVDVYATWCTPCKVMESTVFTDRQTANLLNRDFVSYRLDGERNNGPTVMFLYEVEAFPTLLFLDGDGKLLLKNVGSVSASRLQELAAEAKAKAMGM